MGRAATVPGGCGRDVWKACAEMSLPPTAFAGYMARRGAGEPRFSRVRAGILPCPAKFFKGRTRLQFLFGTHFLTKPYNAGYFMGRGDIRSLLDLL